MEKKIFGETVAGYNIPVLNEREIRASAGILFLFMFIAIMFIAIRRHAFISALLIQTALLKAGVRMG